MRKRVAKSDAFLHFVYYGGKLSLNDIVEKANYLMTDVMIVDKSSSSKIVQ